MRILIYGAGALGQALGCLLTADGHLVDLVLRKRFIDTLSEQGLRVTGLFGDFTAVPKRLGLLEHPASGNADGYDAVLLTTKSYDTASAAETLASLKDITCPIVSMQNGCGNVEQLEQWFARDRIFAARVITGFEITKPGMVAITVSADDVHIGSCRRGKIPDFAHTLAQVINHAGLPCISVEDIYQDLFAKLLYNCALNPLGAVLGVHYGALGDSAETRSIMDRVIDETFAVIKALGGALPWQDAEGYRRVFYETLVPATYNHRPSMLQDLEHGKSTEVEALVGYVCNQGKRLNIPVTTCELLTHLVRFKESVS